MSDAGEFVDAALRREGDRYRAIAAHERLGGDLTFYGSSIGAVRGTVRDLSRRHPESTHDEITALSSELWSVPVFERRLAAVVLLQWRVGDLSNSDLTRIEGFARTAQLRAIVDPLAVDVIGPLVERLKGADRARADAALDRWAHEPSVWLRRAALLSPLRAVRSGGGDREGFTRRARSALAEHPDVDGAVQEAIALVSRELER